MNNKQLDGRKLHDRVAYYKDLIATAQVELDRVSLLEHVECIYELSFRDYSTDRLKTIRINAPVSSVKEAIQSELEKLGTLRKEAYEAYTEWINEQ